jgi:hypothetical protein
VPAQEAYHKLRVILSGPLQAVLHAASFGGMIHSDIAWALTKRFIESLGRNRRGVARHGFFHF